VALLLAFSPRGTFAGLLASAGRFCSHFRLVALWLALPPHSPSRLVALRLVALRPGTAFARVALLLVARALLALASPVPTSVSLRWSGLGLGFACLALAWTLLALGLGLGMGQMPPCGAHHAPTMPHGGIHGQPVGNPWATHGGIVGHRGASTGASTGNPWATFPTMPPWASTMPHKRKTAGGIVNAPGRGLRPRDAVMRVCVRV
jgi:hypothetical protein